MCVTVTHSCPTLCDPVDYSLGGSSVHGILQARILEPRIYLVKWVSEALPFVSYHGAAIGGLFEVKRKVVIPDVHRCGSSHTPCICN